MTITVTGATGQLGRLVVLDLLGRGVAPGEIVAAVRTPEKAADLAARGVQVREADYKRPETLKTALAGTDRLLLVSSNVVGERTSDHVAVIDAAREAGVSLLAYTSIINADTTTIELAREHQATEEHLRGSGVPFVLLRNGWYTENHTASIAPTVEHGALVGAASPEGRLAPAARADYAAAAATVLTGEGHEGQAYELAGDTEITMAGMAAAFADASGRPVAYRQLPVADYEAMLASVGVPAAMAAVLADADAGIDRGALVTDRDDLTRLIGRPTTPVADTVREAAAALQA